MTHCANGIQNVLRAAVSQTREGPLHKQPWLPDLCQASSKCLPGPAHLLGVTMAEDLLSIIIDAMAQAWLLGLRLQQDIRCAIGRPGIAAGGGYLQQQRAPEDAGSRGTGASMDASWDQTRPCFLHNDTRPFVLTSDPSPQILTSVVLLAPVHCTGGVGACQLESLRPYPK